MQYLRLAMLAQTSSRQSTQNAASMLLLIRQLSTRREYQLLPPIMAFGIVPKGGR
jgi:hypothetical protein